MKMNELKIGQKAVVIKIDNSDMALKRRIMDMGITKNAVVEIIKIAPLGDPVAVKVRGFILSLRKNELCAIMVQVITKNKFNLEK